MKTTDLREAYQMLQQFKNRLGSLELVQQDNSILLDINGFTFVHNIATKNKKLVVSKHENVFTSNWNELHFSLDRKKHIYIYIYNDRKEEIGEIWI